LQLGPVELLIGLGNSLVQGDMFGMAAGDTNADGSLNHLAAVIGHQLLNIVAETFGHFESFGLARFRQQKSEFLTSPAGQEVAAIYKARQQ
jgi:hypothetical protein